MNIKCAIVDDEPLALDLLESYVRKTPILTMNGRYSSAVEAMGGIQENPVDIIFLDIQMPDLNGLDFSKTIDTSRTRIIFTTAFNQYAVDGYKVNALDYLLKPVSYVDFIGAVNRAQKWYELNHGPSISTTGKEEDNTLLTSDTNKNQENDENGYIFVKSDYKLMRINFAEILYIEGLKDYVKIYLTSSTKPILSLSSMRSLESILPSNHFFRTHRSYIVNMSKVKILERGQIVFGDKYLPISESYKENVQKYFNAHILQGRGG